MRIGLEQHGPDGLSNIVETHPEFNLPASYVHPRLEVSKDSSASVILQTLAKEEAGTVTIVALGPRELGRARRSERTEGVDADLVSFRCSDQPRPRPPARPRRLQPGQASTLDGSGARRPWKHLALGGGSFPSPPCLLLLTPFRTLLTSPFSRPSSTSTPIPTPARTSSKPAPPLPTPSTSPSSRSISPPLTRSTSPISSLLRQPSRSLSASEPRS